MFYATYKFGAWVINEELIDLTFQFSQEWLQTKMKLIWRPLLTGCLIAGFFSSITGYVLTRYLWRWHVINAWKKRRSDRKMLAKGRNSP